MTVAEVVGLQRDVLVQDPGASLRRRARVAHLMELDDGTFVLVEKQTPPLFRELP